MKKLCTALIVALLCGIFFPAFNGFASGKDMAVDYKCSFDIPLENKFKQHPVYRYAENGVLHVTVRHGSYPIFSFGENEELSVQGVLRKGSNSAWSRRGEYSISAYMNYQLLWDEETENSNGLLQLNNLREEAISPALGEKNDLFLAIDMVEEDGEPYVRMYLYHYNKSDISGVLKPVTEIAEHRQESFSEDIMEVSGDSLGRMLFKTDGKWSTAPEGTQEAENLYQEREDLIDSIATAKPTETKKPEQETVPEGTDIIYKPFTPEKGVVGLYYPQTKRSKDLECRLSETVEFSGIYKEQKAYGGKQIARDGEKIKGVLKNYFQMGAVGHTRDAVIMTLTLSGSQGTQTFWKESGIVSTRDSNGDYFSFEQYVTDQIAVREKRKDTPSLAVTGEIEEDKLKIVKFYLRTVDENFGTMECTDVSYKAEKDADPEEGGDYIWKSFCIDKGSPIDAYEGVPDEYRGLSKEESIEKYGAYYEDTPDGMVRHSVSHFAGGRKGTTYYSRLEQQIGVTLNQNCDGISSDGKTNITIYDFSVTLANLDEEPDWRSRPISDALLCLSGNLGKKYLLRGNTAWHIRPGTTSSTFEGLDSKSAYYGWNSVSEITDTYIDYGKEAGNIQLHFADEARTGLKSMEFNFDGLSCELTLDSIDYTGPFLSYFLPGFYGEKWSEKAKSLGLNPDVE